MHLEAERSLSAVDFPLLQKSVSPVRRSVSRKDVPAITTPSFSAWRRRVSRCPPEQNVFPAQAGIQIKAGAGRHLFAPSKVSPHGTARLFGTDPQFWVNLQARYDLETIERKMRKRIEQEVTPLDAWENGSYRDVLLYPRLTIVSLRYTIVS